ncbi:hypothetical protein FRC17_007939 [Serendipita sp. 399]|nr:hypothetical protein FRC17_007939 [Serendipita sp. 399]
MPPKQKRTAQRQSQLQGSETHRFEYISSISRSGGGDDLDGDSLKNYETQEKYRAWIDEKLLKVEAANNKLGEEREKLAKEDLVRLFRKLREGVIAAKRHDEFATEVYETSLLLAAAYGAMDQVTALAAQILMLNDAEDVTVVALQSFLVKNEITLLLALLHQVVVGMRHPPTFLSALKIIIQRPPSLVLSSDRTNWLRSLVIDVKTQNYHSIRRLTSQSRLTALIQDCLSPGNHGKRQEAAITQEVTRLQHCIRDATWGVVRHAYRDETEDWLAITLQLSSNPGGWLQQKQQIQEALCSDDKPARWKLYKPRM